MSDADVHLGGEDGPQQRGPEEHLLQSQVSGGEQESVLQSWASTGGDTLWCGHDLSPGRLCQEHCQPRYIIIIIKLYICICLYSRHSKDMKVALACNV